MPRPAGSECPMSSARGRRVQSALFQPLGLVGFRKNSAASTLSNTSLAD